MSKIATGQNNDEIHDSFLELLRHDIPQIITVYKYPSDYPDKYVARLWHICAGYGPVNTKNIVIADTLSEIRAKRPAQMTPLNRDARDDFTVVESWI